MSYFKAILFDLNGTLIDICTDEGKPELYHAMAHLLNTYGVPLSGEEFRTLFFELQKEQRKKSHFEHPEFDVIRLFETILEQKGTSYTRQIPREKRTLLPEFLAEAFRATSMIQLRLYPGVHKVLKELQSRYTLAVVSDAQTLWEESETRRLGLHENFPCRVISGDLGFRKPAPEIFRTALEKVQSAPERTIYVGNDMYRDVYGSKALGMKSVFFRSNQGDWNHHGFEPDYIIYRFEELLKAVEFLEAKFQLEAPKNFTP